MMKLKNLEQEQTNKANLNPIDGKKIETKATE